MIRCDKCGHEMRDDWTRQDDSSYSRFGGNCTLSGLDLCYDCAHGFDDDGASIAVRLDHAEARVRELMHLLALVEDDVRDAHTLGLVRAALAGGKE